MAAECLSLRRFFKTLKLFKIPDKYFFGSRHSASKKTCVHALVFHYLWHLISHASAARKLLNAPHRARYSKEKWKKKARTLKGTVPRDFRLQVVLWNQFPPSPWISHEGRFEFFRKFAEIFLAQGAPPAANLPPVSLLLGVLLDLRITLRIFEKILNDPNVIIRGLGEDEPWKNWK